MGNQTPKMENKEHEKDTGIDEAYQDWIYPCRHMQASSIPCKEYGDPTNSFPEPTEANPPTGDNEEAEENFGADVAKTVLGTAGLATAAGVAVPTLATAGLSAAGFSSAGVVAGSIAAAWQASIGSVAAGSAFAGLQSAGALGGFAILGPVGLIAGAVTLVGGAVGGGIYLGIKHHQLQKKKSQSKPNGPEGDEDKPKPNGEEMENDNEMMMSAEVKRSGKVPMLRGINICEECWLQLQIRQYEKLNKTSKNS